MICRRKVAEIGAEGNYLEKFEVFRKSMRPKKYYKNCNEKRKYGYIGIFFRLRSCRKNFDPFLLTIYFGLYWRHEGHEVELQDFGQRGRSQVAMFRQTLAVKIPFSNPTQANFQFTSNYSPKKTNFSKVLVPSSQQKCIYQKKLWRVVWLSFSLGVQIRPLKAR